MSVVYRSLLQLSNVEKASLNKRQQKKGKTLHLAENFHQYKIQLILTFVFESAFKCTTVGTMELCKSNLDSNVLPHPDTAPARSLHVISIRQLKIMFLIINTVLCVNRFDWISIRICMSENELRVDSM